MNRRCLIVSAALAVLMAAGMVAVRRPAPPPAAAEPARATPAKGVVMVATNSHRAEASYSKNGDVRSLPVDPSLEEALAMDSRMDYALRLKVVHDRYGATLSPEQAAFLRAFVADPALPEGLNIRQVRALKNDVLNVLCTQPGEEATTAAMLRVLYADQSQDPALRDYALQHLVTLTERDPSLGWATHWQAIEGADPNLAATAMIHLAAHLRSSSPLLAPGSPPSTLQPFSPSALSSAALRLASDPTAPDPARTTALQICGQLKLAEARPLALDLARADRAGMPLRIAAVATLGDLGGDTATRDYLATLETGPEKRLRVPAKSALKRFSIN